MWTLSARKRRGQSVTRCSLVYKSFWENICMLTQQVLYVTKKANISQIDITERYKQSVIAKGKTPTEGIMLWFHLISVNYMPNSPRVPRIVTSFVEQIALNIRESSSPGKVRTWLKFTLSYWTIKHCSFILIHTEIISYIKYYKHSRHRIHT